MPRKRRSGSRAFRLGRPLVFALAAVATAACGAPEPPRRPNLILITLDTFRADVVGAYGSAEGLTPELDRLADEAVVFDNAVTPMGTTFPAHASLFTGLYPRQHGVRWNGDALDERFTTLAERLRTAGYETAAFVGLPSMVQRGGLQQGFDLYTPPLDDPGRLFLTGEEVNRSALDWLAAEHAGPFFVWLHYFETHSPYRLTAHARERFSRTGYRGPLAEGASTELFYSLGREIPWRPAEREAVWTLYAGEAAHLDGLLGQVFGFLRRSGRLDDSLLVVAADHGEALGEHDLVGHGFLLWQPVLRVPLMIRPPGPAPARSRRVAERVGLIDLPPTILELLDLPPAGPLAGRSLAGALSGGALPPRPYFAESRDLGDNRRWTEREAAAVAAFLGDAKAIWRPDELRVFDLARDPHELGTDAAAVPDRTRARLRRLIEEFRATPTARPAEGELPPEVERELRSLGYLR